MLIVVDGIDGSGKSTLCAALRQSVGEHACRVVRPLHADHRFAAAVRDLFALEPDFARLASTETQRAVAGHYIHQFAERVARDIKPYLSEGQVVVSDRYWYSLLANQHAFGVDCSGWIAALDELPRPDLAIRLTVDVDTAIRRVRDRGDDPWYDASFLRRVDNYLTANSPDFGLVPVDGTQPVTELVQLVSERIATRVRL
ncbi:dTMP kinase [Actinoplanes sp. NEAU-A12]|uniref:Thymidylate kinase n=1 Tax=Actinoplanes sandaracinus TaxID=3045177 RepID=A0ABT6WRB4_9ACTN|nr:dTMP kinase [Actinoplanes sandaracinus]MDI6102282.1 dTMP kinase [Actinoplanes sandaracinus]